METEYTKRGFVDRTEYLTHLAIYEGASLKAVAAMSKSTDPKDDFGSFVETVKRIAILEKRKRLSEKRKKAKRVQRRKLVTSAKTEDK